DVLLSTGGERHQNAFHARSRGGGRRQATRARGALLMAGKPIFGAALLALTFFGCNSVLDLRPLTNGPDAGAPGTGGAVGTGGTGGAVGRGGTGGGPAGRGGSVGTGGTIVGRGGGPAGTSGLGGVAGRPAPGGRGGTGISACQN